MRQRNQEMTVTLYSIYMGKYGVCRGVYYLTFVCSEHTVGSVENHLVRRFKRALKFILKTKIKQICSFHQKNVVPTIITESFILHWSVFLMRHI